MTVQHDPLCVDRMLTVVRRVADGETAHEAARGMRRWELEHLLEVLTATCVQLGVVRPEAWADREVVA